MPDADEGRRDADQGAPGDGTGRAPEAQAPTGPPLFVNPDRLPPSADAPVFVKRDGSVAGARQAPTFTTGGSSILPGVPGNGEPSDGRPVFVTKGGSVVGQGPPGPPAVDPSRPWAWWVGPLTIFFAFVAIFMLFIVLDVVAGGDTSQVADDNEEWLGLAQDLVWIAVALIVPFTVARYLRPDQLGLRRPPNWGRMVGVVAAVMVTFWVASALYSYALGLNDDSNQLLQDTGLGQSAVKDVAYALLFTVAAPIAEELLFRGLLFRTLRDGFHRLGRFGGPVLAAVISGVFFGLIHFGGGQDDFLPVLMLFGVLLALAYHFSGSLYVSIAIHSVNNAIATGFNSDASADWVYVLIGLGPVIAVAVAWLLGRFVKATFPQDRPGQTATASPGQTGDGFATANYQDKFFPPS